MWNKLKGKKGHKHVMLIGILSISILVSVVFVPTVNSYALNIPILKDVAGLLGNNSKVPEDKNANEAIITVSESGYTFKVEKVELNKDRLVITGRVSGPELEYKDGVFPADVEIVPKDFMEGSTAEGGGNKFDGYGDTFVFKIEERYKDGEVEKFLSKSQDYITLDVMIYRRKDIDGKTVARKIESGDEDKRDYRVYWKESDEAIKEFKSIKVPYSYNNIDDKTNND